MNKFNLNIIHAIQYIMKQIYDITIQLSDISIEDGSGVILCEDGKVKDYKFSFHIRL